MNRKSFPYLLSSHLHLLLAATLLVGFSLSLWSVGVGHAAAPEAEDDTCPAGFICVNTFLDEKQGNDGLCSLREAIIAANSDKGSGKPGECAAGSGPDTIILPAGTHILTRTDNGKEDASQTGDLDIVDSLDILVDGPGATIDGSAITDRVFQILAGDVTMTGVTIKNAGSNVENGGGIQNTGALTLTNVTISGNEAYGSGGGIYNLGTLTLNNVTVAYNEANAGGGISNGGGSVNLHNTIVSGNDPGDCAGTGTLVSLGYNLDSDDSCNLVSAGDRPNENALLGPLQNNGGKAETHALIPRSPAIDAGDLLGCSGLFWDDSQGFPQLVQGLLPTDERGEIRPLDGDNDGQARCDIGAFEFRRNNFVLIRAFLNSNTNTTIVQGLLNGTAANTDATLDFYQSDSCTASQVSPVGDPFVSIDVRTEEHGYFTAELDTNPSRPFINAIAKDLSGNPIGYSNCITFGSNTSWPFALLLDDQFVNGNGTAEIDQYLDQLGQSRWYRFQVKPNSEVIVTLTELEQVAANYDLTIYKDIKEAFLAFLVPEENDLVPLNAQFAGDAFAGDAFAGDAFAGDAFAGDAFAGDAFAGDAFAGDAFAGDAFAGDAFAGDAFAGDAFAGDAFAGDAFAGDAFAGDAFAASVFAGDAFAGDAFAGDAFAAAFSSAQFRSLIGVSAFEGTISEGIFVNTWNNNGEFYVRVRGRNGAFSLNAPFHLEVTVISEICTNVSDDLPDRTHFAPDGTSYNTIILTDESRMDLDAVVGPPGAEQPLGDWLDDLAVAANGVVVNVGEDARVAFANEQADRIELPDVNNVACPYAKNLVAQAVKDIVDDYRDKNPLEYVVIVGDDDVIPNFRHPDNALLAPESQYSPPVKNLTASQASLKLDYVLSQDAYGSKFDLSLNNSTYPVPNLAVGRLVETQQEIATVIDAYLNHTDNGVVAPQSSLTTGYDFLYDAALAIRDELEAGTPGAADDALLTDKAPSDPPHPDLWTADQLRDALLPAGGQAPDIAFLAGHFTTNAALAADYVTTMSASEVAESLVDMTNSIIFSAGCHAGYNTVDEHGLDIRDQDGNVIVTKQPDWAQAFASKGATLVAGTGYQYGETDYLEYSERIYLEFSRQLRREGSVPIGKALMEAKKVYLAQTPRITGLHEKALLEATVFGLPFLKVELNGDYEPPTPDQQIPTLSTFTTDPGQTLGLQYGDITVESPLVETTVVFTDVDDLSPVLASYLSGNPFGDNNGVASNLGEPALPLEVRDVSVAGTTLRGVGFRGGRYQVKDVIPVTGAPTTEVSGVHTPFLTDYFHPVQMWRVNYWDVLEDPDGGMTQLMLTPAQHKISSTPTDPQESTRRQFKFTDLRLYYSNDVTDYSTQEGIRSIPGLSGPPVIVRVSAQPNDEVVTFEVLVTSNPAAGVQEVWVTYTDTGDVCQAGTDDFCSWQSLDLTQNPAESTIWKGELDLTGITDAANIQSMVQAVNGVGLVGRAENLGKFFVPGVDPADTKLEIVTADDSGHFSDKATFSARLTYQQGGDPIGGQPLTFRLASRSPNQSGVASLSGVALTGPDGVATINLPLRALPGEYELSAFFAGSATLQPSLAKGGMFTINRQDTAFCSEEFPSVEEECVLSATLAPDPEADTGIVAVLTDDTGRRLQNRTVFFVVEDDDNNYSAQTITDWRGRAFLGPVNLPAGSYSGEIFFINGTLTLPNNLGYPDETVELLDDGYNPTSATFSLTLNTPPVADADGPYTGDEGAPITLDGSLSKDPDAPDDSIVSYEWDLDYDGVTFDAQVTTVQSTTVVSFTDNFLERTIALSVTDSLGGQDVATSTLEVFNVAPTVTGVDGEAIAGQEAQLQVATFTDPGTADTHTATIDWGDDTECDTRTTDPDCAVTEEAGSGSVSGTHTYHTPGSFEIKVEVCDDDGDCASPEDSPLVTVKPSSNQPPVAVPGGPYEADEGSAVEFDGSDSSDPDGDELTYQWDFGDGSNAETGSKPTHIYADDGEYTVTLTVTDPSGAGNSETAVATISNVAPMVHAGDDQTVNEGETVSVTAIFTDPGKLDTHTATIDWGDYTECDTSTGPDCAVTEEAGSGSVSGTHTYDTPGEYTVTVTVTDDDGDSGSDTLIVTVVGPVSDPQTIWPPNGKMVLVRVVMPDSNGVIVTIDSVFQDEPVGKEPDAEISSDGQTVLLRAERDGKGNGRVYHIFFTVTVGGGDTYSDDVTTAIVPHDQSGDIDKIDEGPLYDSTQVD